MIELIIGIAGMGCILIAFILDEFYCWFNQETIQYNVLNMVGSALLLYYAFSLRGWPFVVLNAVWFLVATVKLVRVLAIKKKKRSKRQKG